ncbi:MAG: CBS domain-containing protein [Caldilineaceae bacterium]|nr:CBS domain-containing protein [Caldilineaceae bacterium]
MLVKDCMTRHPIMISPETPAEEAERLMVENGIRHLPVVEDGKRLVGLLTRSRLSLKPDAMGSLNVWEISRYVSNVKVRDLMVKRRALKSIEPDRAIERAAAVMSEHRIGCLPVVDADFSVVGIVTEIDVFAAFEEMLGLPRDGIRVTVRMRNQPGEFAKLIGVLAARQWGVMGIGTFPSPRKDGYYDAVIKIPDVTLDDVQAELSKLEGQQIVDIRAVT